MRHTIHHEQEVKDLCLLDFGKLHSQIFHLTNVPKYRSFQYRLLQRALVTNIELKKWGIVQDNRCSFCYKQPETILHIIYQCEEVRKVWNSFLQYVKEKYPSQQIFISENNVILNTMVKKRKHVINLMCLITKQYIYRQRCLGKVLSFPELRACIEHIQKIERYIAIKNGKLQVHLQKWEQPKHVFNQGETLSQYVINHIYQNTWNVVCIIKNRTYLKFYGIFYYGMKRFLCLNELVLKSSLAVQFVWNNVYLMIWKLQAVRLRL